MFEKKFRILDENGREIACGMSLDMAIVFVKGYVHEYFNEHLLLTIEEQEPVMDGHQNAIYQQLLQDVHDYQGSICCYCKNYNRNKCEHFGDLQHEDGIPLSCGKFMWRNEVSE